VIKVLAAEVLCVRFLTISIIGTILIATTVVAGIPRLMEDGQHSSRPLRAVAGDVQPRQGEVFANGVVEGRCREIALGFELAGRVLGVDVQEGDRVSAGQLLARLDAATWQQGLAEAEASLGLARAEKERLQNGQREETRQVFAAEVRVAQIQVEQKRKNYTRAVSLNKDRLIAEQAFDEQEGDLLRAEAELQLADRRAKEADAEAREDEIGIADAKITLQEARVAHARAILSKTELRAPCDGLILQVRTEPGELVGDQRTAGPLMTMTDDSQLRVRALVEELDALRIGTGTNASIAVDGLPGQRFRGSVVSCSPCMVPKTQFSNRPGERVDVKVRELVILLAAEQESLSRLVIGLPVDVFLNAER
jgi:multidrug resistance efflux pump